LREVARICRVPHAQVRYWQRMRLIGPRRRERPRGVFAFADLVSVRRIKKLLDAGVPLRHIRRSLDSLRERLPEAQRSLDALALSPAVTGRVAMRHAGVLVEASGQLVLDLGASGAGRLASLEPSLCEARQRGAADAHEQAEAWFERGCKLDSERATWSEAIEAYERALEACPDFADAHCNLGTVYYNQNRKGHARECFERALACEPRHVEAHLNLAALFEEEGRGESALGHYKRALAADPLCADTHVSLALLYEKLELRQHARGHWRRYLQLDPRGAWADVARRHLDA
jgi:tetratricopeptide (TPR) repeat protein